MNEMRIECPGCGCEVPVTELLQAQLESQVRQEMQASLASQRKQLEQREAELTTAQEKLKHSSEQVQQQVAAALETERKKLSEEMLAKARESVQVELTDRNEELTELKQRLKESEKAELDLRRRERELKEQAERVEIEIERKLEAERGTVREEAMRQADEKYELKTAEKDKQIADMRKKIDELRRKSEQTSQQLQGEVQELALEERLRAAFPGDNIDAVGKGRNGADVGQAVCDPSGQAVGKIIYESKRTKNWNDDWLPKIRDDLRQSNADVAVIVTETMPEGITTIGCIEGVWVCRWDCVIGMASAIRSGLIEVAALQKANANRGTKVELLYDYFAGNNFRNRISGVVEAFQALQTDLVKEKAATQRQWAKRERQLERAIINMAGLYGDFQGIVGEVVPALESFEPLKLGAGNPNEDDAAEVDAA